MRLDDLEEALTAAPEMAVFYLRAEDRMVVVEHEAWDLANRLDPVEIPDDLHDWHRTALAEARLVLAADPQGAVPLSRPDAAEDYKCMVRFVQAQGEPARSRLFDTLDGRGAFRCFRAEVDLLGLREAWHEWCAEATRRHLRAWAAANSVPLAE